MTTDARVRCLQSRANADGPRIEKYEQDGKAYWIKRPERLSFRMRLQKGDPARAFAAEVAAHQDYAAQGLPVAKVIAASDTYIITQDCGVQLQHLARSNDSRLPKALEAAARALAIFHGARVNHGRPYLKDICWQNGHITFLDLERAGRDGNSTRAQAMDVLILIFSTAVETREPEAMTLVRNSYINAGRDDVWADAKARARRFAVIAKLLHPVTARLRGKREFDAIGPFFDFMR